MGAEDFSYYLLEKPGCYFLIGNGDGDHRDGGHGLGPCMLHNPSYDFNDALIPLGRHDVGPPGRSMARGRRAAHGTLMTRPAATDAPAVRRRARVRRALDFVERVGNRLPDPVMIFVVLIAAVMVLSAIGAAAGWSAVNPVTKESIRAASLFSSSNLQRLFVEMPRTLTGFAPLGYVLLVMLGAGLAERTGLAGAAMRAAVKGAPTTWLTPIVIFVSVMGNQAGDAAFVVMIPLAGALFAAAGRHPIVGIAASFAGVAGGFSANLLPGQLDALLLGITEPAAQLLVPGWKMNIAGNWYFIVGMTCFMVPLGWYVTERIVAPRFGDWTPTPGAPVAEVGTDLTGERATRTSRGRHRGPRGRGRVCVAHLAWRVVRREWRRAVVRRGSGGQGPLHAGAAATPAKHGRRLLPAVPGHGHRVRARLQA